MPTRPVMPIPPGECTPDELRAQIEQWAASHGYICQFRPGSREYGTMVVHDPAGGRTYTTIYNPHHGRRLRKDQIRYEGEAPEHELEGLAPCISRKNIPKLSVKA